MHLHILIKTLLQIDLPVEQLPVLLPLLPTQLLIKQVLFLDNLHLVFLNHVQVLDFSPLQHTFASILLHL